MEAGETSDLLAARRRSGKPYLQFLRVSSMSCGLYELPRGDPDRQRPHSEDEVYYVIRGHAQILVGSEERAVRPGTIVFVPALMDHRLHDLEEDLALLVFFAPSERTRAGAAAVRR